MCYLIVEIMKNFNLNTGFTPQSVGDGVVDVLTDATYQNDVSWVVGNGGLHSVKSELAATTA